MNQQKPFLGFTIIELLVVITVISVISVIAVMGVRGTQVQARNSQTAGAVQAYKEALEKYVYENGSYPNTGGSCLGVGYGDYNSDGSAGDCWHLNSPSKESATFITNLRPYINEMPLPSTEVLAGPSYNQVGAIFNVSATTTVDGVLHKYLLAYTIEGDHTKCPVGPLLSSTGWPNFSTTPPASGYTETYGSVGVGCWLMLPDPDKL